LAAFQVITIGRFWVITEGMAVHSDWRDPILINTIGQTPACCYLG